jgi:hypothetical protein
VTNYGLRHQSEVTHGSRSMAATTIRDDCGRRFSRSSTAPSRQPRPRPGRATPLVRRGTVGPQRQPRSGHLVQLGAPLRPYYSTFSLYARTSWPRPPSRSSPACQAPRPTGRTSRSCPLPTAHRAPRTAHRAPRTAEELTHGRGFRHLRRWMAIRPPDLQSIACRGRQSADSDASCHLRVGSHVACRRPSPARGVAQHRREQTRSQVARRRAPHHPRQEAARDHYRAPAAARSCSGGGPSRATAGAQPMGSTRTRDRSPRRPCNPPVRSPRPSDPRSTVTPPPDCAPGPTGGRSVNQRLRAAGLGRGVAHGRPPPTNTKAGAPPPVPGAADIAETRRLDTRRSR